MRDGPVILCPGQGAQRVGMGREWFGHSPDAARTFGAADEIVGDRFGRRLSELCFDGPEDVLNQTDVSQPAIFVTSVASFQALFGSIDPASLGCAAGLSLGEYTALHIAGAVTFADALNLVLLRGRAMQDAADSSDGSMVALIGADEEQAASICAHAKGADELVPANFNAPGQIVISGSSIACDRALEAADGAGLRATRLSVAGAFHSPLMRPAGVRLQEALGATPFRGPMCPVVSNVSAAAYAQDDSAAEEIRARLVDQLTSPVLWSQSCQWIASEFSGEYHELAPNKVLSGLMRRIERKIKVQNHDAPDA